MRKKISISSHRTREDLECPKGSTKQEGIRGIKHVEKQMQMIGLLKKYTIDSYSNFVFLKKDGQLLNAGGLNLLIHCVVYECNAGKIANAVRFDIDPELLLNSSTHILRHIACTHMVERGMTRRALQEIMRHQNMALTIKVYYHVDDKVCVTRWTSWM